MQHLSHPEGAVPNPGRTTHSGSDRELDRDLGGLARLAAWICGTPMAYVTLTTCDGRVFEARHGFAATSCLPTTGLCRLVVERAEALVVEDAAADPGHAADPLVAMGTRFFAGMPLFERNGRPAGMLCVLDGVPRVLTAEQAEALQTLARQVTITLWLSMALGHAEESEARFRNMADHAPVIMWITDPSGRCTYLNRRWYEFTGQEEADALGLGWLKATHPDDREQAQAIFLAANAGRHAFRIDYRLRRADGTYHWAIDAASPRFDEEGRFLGYVGSVIDIDERRRTEEALRASESRFQAISNSIDQMIWSTTPDGYHDYFNDRWYSYTGVPRGSTDGAAWNGMFHPDDQARAWQVWRHSLETGEPYHIEYRLRHHTGAYRWVLGRAHPVRDAGGSIARWFGTCTEIQDIVDARDVLARSREDLEREVAARAEALMQAEERLRQSQKMEAVGQLTGGLAHDFNNLLTGISGSLELLGTRIAQGRFGEAERYITAAQGAARRAAALTHRLLAFSRRQALDPKPTDINRLVAGMEELVRRMVGPAVQVEVVGAAGLWSTLVDANQLENALLNLCINARDAMPEGGRLTIETANKWLDDRAGSLRDLPTGQYVTLCVTDTGTGMTPEVIARAFDPFFTTKPIGQGTGLGLSMIYGFVRQSEGQVRVYSEVGEGTTVCIYLPRHLAAGEEPQLPSAPDLPGQGGSRGTVLVVDDDPTVRMLVVEVLEELGHAVIEAADGAAALQALAQDLPIDLLVTDVGLPGGLSGRQVAEAALASRPEMRILFITGYGQNAAMSSGHLAPGMQVLTKPFALHDLATRVHDLIGKDHPA